MGRYFGELIWVGNVLYPRGLVWGVMVMALALLIVVVVTIWLTRHG